MNRVREHRSFLQVLLWACQHGEFGIGRLARVTVDLEKCYKTGLGEEATSIRASEYLHSPLHGS